LALPTVIEGQYYVVTHIQIAYPWTQFFDDSRTLVADDERDTGCDARYARKEIGVAQAGADNAHQHFACAWRCEIYFFEVVQAIR